MKNLPTPTYNSQDAQTDLKKAIKQYRYSGKLRGHTITPKEIKKMLEIYELYDSKLAEPDEKLRGETLSKKFLKHIYESYDRTQKNRNLNHIRKLVFAKIAHCPICGITKPTHLDHHLPISKFKPLSIYPKNLIPLCADCNTIKRDELSETQRTRLIHAYFDTIPEGEFLNAIITITGNALNVKFIINNIFPPNSDLAERLENQLIKLNLNDRYFTEINKCLSNHAVQLHRIYLAEGANSIKAYLKTQSKHSKNEYHLNHWQPVLLRALSESDAFCEGGFIDVLPVDQEILENA